MATTNLHSVSIPILDKQTHTHTHKRKENQHKIRPFVTDFG